MHEESEWLELPFTATDDAGRCVVKELALLEAEDLERQDFELPTIVIGDSRSVLRRLPSRLVQTTVTSPPYWSLRDYDIEGQIGLESSSSSTSRTSLPSSRRYDESHATTARCG